jgi:hypothetical protein
MKMKAIASVIASAVVVVAAALGPTSAKEKADDFAYGATGNGYCNAT